MPIIQEEKFKQKSYKKTARVLSIKLNKGEYELYKACQAVIHQAKLSTCIKDLAEIGAIVVHDPLTSKILNTILENKRKNKRLGIVDIKEEINAKVRLNR